MFRKQKSLGSFDPTTVVRFAPPAQFDLVYIAGPYTKPDPNHNVHRTVMVAETLIDAGLIPYVPHLHHLWDTISPHNWQYWMRIVTAIIPRVDVMLVLPGESRGAELEQVIAAKHQIPIYFDLEKLLYDKRRSSLMVHLHGGDGQQLRLQQDGYVDSRDGTRPDEIRGGTTEGRTDSAMGDVRSTWADRDERPFVSSPEKP